MNTSIINILPDFVANQIAAGEVVNRPASAVKELLENAVDAGADRIELHIEDAGKTLVQVVDNGCGMKPEDAQKCFLPHATSKLATADDLLSLQTMGFRGEALASIAAVAQVELQTRPKEDETGTLVVIEGGKILRNEPCACTPGTCIKVKNIYFNTPARRQFLKSDDVEYRYVEEEFNRVALVHPQIRFELYRNGRKIYLLEAGNFKKRIVALMGKSFDSRLIKVAEKIPDVEVTGYLCNPDYAVKGRGKQFLFVNRRFVRHPYLSNAVEKAYQDLLPEGKNPVFFLHLSVNPHSIDVNIHPTKTEIRFKDEHLLYGLLLSACKHALGVSQIRDTLDFGSEQALPYQYKPQGYIPQAPSVKLQPGYNPFHTVAGKESGPQAVPTDSRDYRAAYGESFARMHESPVFQDLADEASKQLLLDGLEDVVADTRHDNAGNPDRADTKAADTVRIFQIFDRYIVTPLKSGLAFIDQEAASERIIYNDYVRPQNDNVPSQSTLFPQTVELSSSHAQILNDVRDKLNTLGWAVEWVGANSFILNAFPVGIQESRVQEILESLLDDYAASLLKTSSAMEDRLALAMARQMSVKAGTNLSQEEMFYIVNRLFSETQAETSPSGKKTLWILSEKALSDMFSKR